MSDPKYQLNRKDTARWRALLTRHCLNYVDVAGKQHRSKKFPPLSTAEALKIWRVLSTQYKAGLDEKTLVELAENTKFKGISGRSIKNLLKLAKLLAATKKKPITVADLEYVSQFLDLKGRGK